MLKLCFQVIHSTGLNIIRRKLVEPLTRYLIGHWNLCPMRGHALDIGAGAGIETLEMLKHGLAVRSLGVLERAE